MSNFVSFYVLIVVYVLVSIDLIYFKCLLMMEKLFKF